MWCPGGLSCGRGIFYGSGVGCTETQGDSGGDGVVWFAGGGGAAATIVATASEQTGGEGSNGQASSASVSSVTSPRN